MILAETLPDPNGYAALGWLIVGLAALIAIINQGWDFVAKVSGKDKNPLPQPLSVSGTPPGNSELQMSVKQLNARVKVLEQWRSDLINKMDEDKTEILAAGEERARRIYTHVEDVRKEIDGKIHNLPNELVALLKNTGAIK